MLFPLTSAAVIACILAAYGHDERRSPLVLALAAWGASLLLASPIIFKYAVDYSIRTDAFVATCLSAATVAYLLFRRAPRPAPSTYVHRTREIRISKLLGVAGALGCLLLLADAHATNGLQFSLSYLLDNVSTIRTDQFEGLASGVDRGLVGTLGGLVAPCAVLSVIGAVRLGREGGQAVRWLGIVNFALVAAVSLRVFAGRATIVNLALLVLVSLFVSGRRLSPLRPRTLAVGALLLVCAWYFATGWFGTREDHPNTLVILQGTQRAELRPWIAGIVARDESAGLAAVSVGYFASPLPTLAFYMQQRPTPGPYYGAYSYPLPARVLGTVRGTWTRDEWYAIRQDIYAPIESQNYFGNVWSTWLRDLLVDFGFAGAIMFCGLFGAFMAWARNRYELTGALHYHYLEVTACFSLGFGAFTSFLFDPFVALPFFFALAVMFAVRPSTSAPIRRRALTGYGLGP